MASRYSLAAILATSPHFTMPAPPASRQNASVRPGPSAPATAGCLFAIFYPPKGSKGRFVPALKMSKRWCRQTLRMRRSGRNNSHLYLAGLAAALLGLLATGASSAAAYGQGRGPLASTKQAETGHGSPSGGWRYGWPGQQPEAAQVSTAYWLASAQGKVWSFGGAPSFSGLPDGTALAGQLVEVEPTPNGQGYWLVTSVGEIFSFGTARYFGGTVGVRLAGSVVGLTPTPDAKGYWVATSAGQVFSFGDAHYFGAAAGDGAKRVVRLVTTPDGGGYWLLTASGAIYSFGDARYYGAAGAARPTAPIVDMAPAPDGRGYWLLASNGSVYSFGDAHYGGGAPVDGGDPAERFVAASGGGYWVVEQDGTAWPFGGAQGPPPAQGLIFRPVTPGDRAVLFALSQLGKPYIWGGTGPAGYDCSGLAYRSWYVATGEPIPRVSDYQYAGAGTPVAWSKLRAGDLIFWGANKAKWASVYHTAMYVGGSQIVESTGGGVQVNSVYQWGGSNLMVHGMRP